MSTHNNLDKLGKFIVENLRGRGIDYANILLEGKWKAPDLQNIQSDIAELS